MKYLLGSEAACDAPPCCRVHSKHPDKTTDVIGEGIVAPARLFGEYHCDTPLAMLQSAMDAARQLKPDFVVWGGDTGPHVAGDEHLNGGEALLEETAELRARVLDAISNATTIFAKMFPDVPVFPVLGDDDMVPSSVYSGASSARWLMTEAASLWKKWLPPSALLTLQWGGYYTAQTASGMRVAVLNTAVCDIQNMHNFIDGGASARTQLHWLESVLAGARAAGEPCLITGHIPPGVYSGCWGNYSAAYEELLSRYTDVVAGQIFGHQHSGSFRLLRSPSTSATPPYGVAYVTPSFTAYRDQNPSFRLYQLSRSPLMVSDVEQYHLNLGKANAEGSKGALLWSPSYVPRTALGLPDLSPAQWQGVLNRMWANETFAGVLRLTEANGRAWMGHNTELRDYLCALTGVTDQEFVKCARKSEEIMIRQYTGSQHTYVLTAMFQFQTIIEHFRHVLGGVHPDDVAHVGGQ
eukprot:CAMPEP_0118923918 /NCGR_PEP_ID=MMETSP1169-20130426/2271_1 /TAXON_ID=36882 /ORGANISM="Pyramimonas obovata, Strain CCMP722" /LENGTH=465 /DNA_ID=CAMNT_0006864979 /DNA_START=397 /DNA_END=1794 /DNA_ORIENTATION=+